jgi:predicted RNA polymerase sigma factor
MPSAVLALILLTEARRPARTNDLGEPILLPDQDRTLWEHSLIVEGSGLLTTSLRRTGGVADPYQLQAAIAAEHDGAPSYAATHWDEVVRLYDLLVSVAPSGPAGLSRAVAIAERDGTEAGLAALDGLSDDAPRVAAIRSELLARAGRYAEAVVAAQASLAGAANDPEREFRVRRLADWRVAAGSDAPV